MTPRHGLAVSAGVTLLLAASAGALALLIVLDGTRLEVALLVINVALTIFGLWLSRRWVALLVAAEIAEETSAERAWGLDAVVHANPPLTPVVGLKCVPHADGSVDIRKWSGLV